MHDYFVRPINDADHLFKSKTFLDALYSVLTYCIVSTSLGFSPRDRTLVDSSTEFAKPGLVTLTCHGLCFPLSPK